MMARRNSQTSQHEQEAVEHIALLLGLNHSTLGSKLRKALSAIFYSLPWQDRTDQAALRCRLELVQRSLRAMSRAETMFSSGPNLELLNEIEELIRWLKQNNCLADCESQS